MINNKYSIGIRNSKFVIFLLSFVPGIGRILANAAPIIILFIFTKFASTSEIGVLNYLISLVVIISVFTDFGLQESIQRFLPISKDRSLIYSTIVLEFAVTLIAGVIFVIADVLSNYTISKGYTIYLFFIIFFSASNVILLTFNGLGEKLRTGFYFFGLSSLFLILALTFALSGIDIIRSFLWARLLSWGIFTIIPLLDFIYRKLLVYRFGIPKRYISFTLNSLGIIFSYTMINQWDSIIITYFYGSFDNGVYKSIAFLGSLPYVLGTILQTKLLPEYSHFFGEKNLKEFKKSFNLYTRFLSGLTLVMFIVSFIFQKQITSIFFNQEISDNGSFYLPLVVLGVSFYVMAIPAISALQAIGKENLARNTSFLQVVLFIITTTILVKPLGIIIIPLALIIANFSLFVINYLNASKEITFQYIRD